MSKQPKTTVPTDADLKGNPMIGGSKGVTRTGQTPDEVDEALADNTIEGDTMNGTTADGGIDRGGPDVRK